jgi:Invasion associated locus B (IalB) protein
VYCGLRQIAIPSFDYPISFPYFFEPSMLNKLLSATPCKGVLANGVRLVIWGLLALDLARPCPSAAQQPPAASPVPSSSSRDVVPPSPLGGYLVPGMELRIEGAKPERVLYETCNAAGCHGGFALSGRIRDLILSAKHTKVRVWTTKDTPIDVDVSLAGFRQAVEAMRVENK